MLALAARISWEVPHARQRAMERGVSIVVAERVIRNGAITQISMEPDGSERWTISGKDPDGRAVDVVVTPIGTAIIRVITVISAVKRSKRTTGESDDVQDGGAL
jgi:uncharacterized DUF497 family protein